MQIKVVSIPELADKSGKNACTLAEESETQGMLQVILEEKETRVKNKKPEEERVEEEDASSVRISPREKRPSVLPEDFIDPEQVGTLFCFEIVVLCVVVVKLFRSRAISEKLFLQIHIEDMGCENMPPKTSSKVSAPEDKTCDETENGAEENVETD